LAGPALNRVVADFKCAATGDRTVQFKALRGQKFMSVERSTFLIDENGRLREEWRKVKVKGQAAAVLDAVKKC